MNIVINGKNLQKRIINGQEVEKVIRNGVQIRPESTPPTPPTPTSGPLCFVANTNNCSVRMLTQMSTPANLQVSTDGTNWRTYFWAGGYGENITLNNAGDRIYFRNQDSITAISSLRARSYFEMTGSISASGDVTYLLNPNGTTTIGDYAFYRLFKSCTSLTTSPAMPATILGNGCYRSMFEGCTSLTTLPQLPATEIGRSCYWLMFSECTSIKLSETQTGEYQTPYRIPSSGTGIDGGALDGMFDGTGGTFTGTPTVNTTYYTSNTVI